MCVAKVLPVPRATVEHADGPRAARSRNASCAGEVAASGALFAAARLQAPPDARAVGGTGEARARAAAAMSSAPTCEPPRRRRRRRAPRASPPPPRGRRGWRRARAAASPARWPELPPALRRRWTMYRAALRADVAARARHGDAADGAAQKQVRRRPRARPAVRAGTRAPRRRATRRATPAARWRAAERSRLLGAARAARAAAAGPSSGARPAAPRRARTGGTSRRGPGERAERVGAHARRAMDAVRGARPAARLRRRRRARSACVGARVLRPRESVPGGELRGGLRAHARALAQPRLGQSGASKAADVDAEVRHQLGGGGLPDARSAAPPAGTVARVLVRGRARLGVQLSRRCVPHFSTSRQSPVISRLVPSAAPGMCPTAVTVASRAARAPFPPRPRAPLAVLGALVPPGAPRRRAEKRRPPDAHARDGVNVVGVVERDAANLAAQRRGSCRRRAPRRSGPRAGRGSSVARSPQRVLGARRRRIPEEPPAAAPSRPRSAQRGALGARARVGSGVDVHGLDVAAAWTSRGRALAKAMAARGARRSSPCSDLAVRGSRRLRPRSRRPEPAAPARATADRGRARGRRPPPRRSTAERARARARARARETRREPRAARRRVRARRDGGAPSRTTAVRRAGRRRRSAPSRSRCTRP